MQGITVVTYAAFPARLIMLQLGMPMKGLRRNNAQYC